MLRDRVNFWMDGDGYHIAHCRDIKQEANGFYVVRVSPLGAATYEVEEGCDFGNNGVAVSGHAIRDFYDSLKRHFEGSNNPLKEHHDDMRSMAFGLLDVLKRKGQ